jgi:hypothetical protein
MEPINLSKKIRTWLFKKECFITKTKNINKEITHVLLSGGKVSIPFDLQDEFLKIQASIIDLGNQGNLYFSEMKTDVYRYMIDYDFQDEVTITPQKIIDIGKKIQSVLSFFLSPYQDSYKNRVIVCCNDAKEKMTDNGEIIYKNGIHFIWPDVFVTNELSMMLRSALVQHFENEGYKRPEYNTWEDIFDLAIYKHAGLRIIGNNKAKKCEECKGKGNDNDCICSGIGKFDDGRPYKLLTVIDLNGNILDKEQEKLEYDTHELLKQTIIRSDKKLPNIKINKFPEWFDTEILKTHCDERQKKKAKRRKIKEGDNIIEVKTSKIKSKVPRTDQKYIDLDNYLKYAFKNDEHYSDFEIINLYTTKDKKKSYIVQANLSYCHNVKREHNSNHIYFIINGRDILQKCHSEHINEDGQCCSEFKHTVGKINFKIKRLLFDEIDINVKKEEESKQKEEKVEQSFKFQESLMSSIDLDDLDSDSD